MRPVEHVVTGGHNGMAYPRLVAERDSQHAWLVDTLLREAGPIETLFYVWDAPVTFPDASRRYPHRWMRSGYHGEFGAVFFYDDTAAPEGDWAWLALNPEPLQDAPTIFFDAPTPVIFPPVAVMPLGRLREVILEWCATGARPIGVRWMAINDQQWDLDQQGTVIHSYPGPQQTMHYLVGDQVVREYGWGTDRTAPDQAQEVTGSTLADHRTGRTNFGTAGPEES